MSKNLQSRTSQFIEKALKIHGNLYCYDMSVYMGSNVKICIKCPEHGDFWQTPGNHLSGKECLKCSYEKNNYIIVFNYKFLCTNTVGQNRI